MLALLLAMVLYSHGDGAKNFVTCYWLDEPWACRLPDDGAITFEPLELSDAETFFRLLDRPRHAFVMAFKRKVEGGYTLQDLFEDSSIQYGLSRLLNPTFSREITQSRHAGVGEARSAGLRELAANEASLSNELGSDVIFSLNHYFLFQDELIVFAMVCDPKMKEENTQWFGRLVEGVLFIDRSKTEDLSRLASVALNKKTPDLVQVEALLKSGCSPNVIVNGKTLVHHALDADRTVLAKLLLDHGANPMLGMDWEVGTLLWSRVGGALFDRWKRDRFSASRSAPSEDGKKLNVPVLSTRLDQLDWYREMPREQLNQRLVRAAGDGDVDDVEALIEVGAYPGAKNQDGKTASELATEMMRRFEEVDLDATDFRTIVDRLNRAQEDPDAPWRKQEEARRQIVLFRLDEDTLNRFSDGIPAAGYAEVGLPVLKKAAAPEYPDEAMSTGLEGTVDLAVVIDAMGHIYQVSVLHGLVQGRLGFEREAEKAAHACQFEPAKEQGDAVMSRVGLKVAFSVP